MVKRIEIRVKSDGKVRLETSGFSGKNCMEADEVLKALSNNIKTTKKSEYYANEQPNDVTIVGQN